MMGSSIRIALVHDWLTSMRGGEKCLEVLCELFPEAVVHTLVHVPGSVSPTIEQLEIRTSFIQRLPDSGRRYRYYLPLFPAAIERFDMSEFDVIISSHHCVAKGVRPRPGALHLCYCHTPMRYLWDMYDEYFGAGRASLPVRAAMKAVRPYLQKWDRASANRVTEFIANSAYVRERIGRIYNRTACVIFPPVDVSRFGASTVREDFLLLVGALVPYKRTDLAIEACNTLGRKLTIVGSGPEEAALRRMAGPTVTFLGRKSDAEIADLYRRCSALLFPGVEDFGIVPLEAMASGKPVVAYAKGGALETVVDGTTGVFFREQTHESLADAIRRLETLPFDPAGIRRHSLEFDRPVYKETMKNYILGQIEHHRGRGKDSIK